MSEFKNPPNFRVGKSLAEEVVHKPWEAVTEVDHLMVGDEAKYLQQVANWVEAHFAELKLPEGDMVTILIMANRRIIERLSDHVQIVEVDTCDYNLVARYNIISMVIQPLTALTSEFVSQVRNLIRSRFLPVIPTALTPDLGKPVVLTCRGKV